MAEKEFIIVYRPDGVARLYRIGEKAMNDPGESLLGEVEEIILASADENNDFCEIVFTNKTRKIYSGMPYVHTEIKL